MTKITRKNQDDISSHQESIRSRYSQNTQSAPHSPSSTTSDDKSHSGSAVLAQQLASQSSWAERYVPSTPSETIMTPTSSVVLDHDEQQDHLRSEHPIPSEDAPPPSYEEVTGSIQDLRLTPSQQQDGTIPGTGFQGARSTQIQRSPNRPRLPGRRYSRHETSQSIKGTFTLYDSLNLSTTSGSISIKLEVQPGSEPAHLTLKTQSGSVGVEDKQCHTAMSHGSSCPSQRSSTRASGSSGGNGLLSFLWGSRSNSSATDNSEPPIPSSDDPRKQPGQHLSTQEQDLQITDTSVARVVHTTIETSSGSVNGQLLLTATSRTAIKTSSGSINLRLVTADTSASKTAVAQIPAKLAAENPQQFSAASIARNLGSTLTTTSNSGSQSIHITTGVTDTSEGAIISACTAKHHSTGSASVRAEYSRDWMGLVHASSGGSGSVNVRGDGLEFDRRGSRETWAWRGVDLPDVDRAVEVRCDGSGSVNFGC